MIIDTRKNVGIYSGIGAPFAKAFTYLKENDFAKIKVGTYEIDSDNIFAIVQEYETKTEKEGKWEAHQKYIDIQYLVSGVEKMGFANIEAMKIIEEYDNEKDCLFLEGNGNFFTIKEGMFTIFFPEDVHMPCISKTTSKLVKKVVIKIKVESF